MIGLLDLYGASVAPARFEVGDLVHHRLYGYRGVVIAADPCCQAGEKWYQSNKTQPDRNQPWYHVLVHDSGGLSTYVAQSNLEPDTADKPIEHPRIACYFAGFEDGHYVPRAGGG
jgi:heat shock protein HspQ